MKQLSRRDFLKGSAASALSVAAVSLLGSGTVLAEEKGTYTPGTYTSTATGIGNVTVQMTFDAENITKVIVDVSEETPTIGGLYGQDLAEAILAAQGADIDAISGATTTTVAVKKAAEACIAQAKGEAVEVAAPTGDNGPVDGVDADRWMGEEPELPTEFAEELDVDVVVLGAGLAGVCAARSAVDEGASVALFEKSAGIGARSSDYCVFGWEKLYENYPRTAKFRDAKWPMVEEYMKLTMGCTKDEIYTRFFDEVGDVFDWFVTAPPAEKTFFGSEADDVWDPEKYDFGVFGYNSFPDRYDPANEAYPCWPVSVYLRNGNTDYASSNSGAFVQANLDKAIEDGGDRMKVYFETPGIRLIKEDGRVTGVIAQAADGSYIRANAAKGVVLATGGFLSNDAMMKHFLPKIYKRGYSQYYGILDKDGNRCNTGDGHKMGTWVGARMQQESCVMAHSNGGAVGSDPYLLLNRNGKRFMNEDIPGASFGERICGEPGMQVFQFFDSSWPEQLEFMPYGHGKRTQVSVIERNIANALENGKTVQADTIEELLEACGIEDVDAAKASIERYNELAAAGSDSDFGKRADRMFVLDKAPFYCNIITGTDVLVTVSGLESDNECRTYDEDFNVIPGLYVAGNVQGNRFAGNYPETTLGISHSFAMFYGYVAGNNAANAE